MSPRALTGIAVLLILAAAAPGCARRPQAKTSPTPPPLDVPMPPPRIIESAEAEVPQPVGLIDEPARTPTSRPRAASPPQKPEQPRTEATKPEATPEAARPAEEPRQQPPPTLQTTPVQQEREVEARVRGLLTRATSDLSRVDYRQLGANARTQYDTAKGFIKQSEDALKMKNLLFASSLADKAAALAAQLAGR